MKTSIVTGYSLPETEAEFQKLKEGNALRYTNCLTCRSAFDHSVVFTAPGWRETQITGWCEKCFDDMFKEH